MADDFSSSSSDESGNTPSISSTLKAHFNQAIKFVQQEALSPTAVPNISSNTLLVLYGLYKVATVGPCRESKPGILDPKGRAKWTMWSNHSKLTKAEAMQEYVDKVKAQYLWNPNENAGASYSKHSTSNSSSIMGGNAVSTFARPSDETVEKCSEEIFSWVKEGKTDLVESWLKEENDPNTKDEDGLTLLHWSVDRGHLEICQLLLRHGSDPNISDGEGDNALDYALTCEHKDIAELLRSF